MRDDNKVLLCGVPNKWDEHTKGERTWYQSLLGEVDLPEMLSESHLAEQLQA